MAVFLEWFLESRTIGLIGMFFGFFILAYFIYLYVGKDGRDERGRGIFAKASFIALLSFLVLLNVFAALIAFNFSSLSTWAIMNVLQVLFNTVLLIHVIATLIFMKIR